MVDILWQRTRFLLSVADARKFPQSPQPLVAVAGHSNVGKSSLLNALFASNKLVKVAKAPGCTRLLNLFSVDDRLRVVDLPGYGYARAAKGEKRRWQGLIESFLTENTTRPTLILSLLDIRHGPKPDDLELISWLNAHALRWQPVATKADKLSGNSRTIRLREMEAAIGLMPLATSSEDMRGIEQLRTLIAAECGF